MFPLNENFPEGIRTIPPPALAAAFKALANAYVLSV